MRFIALAAVLALTCAGLLSAHDRIDAPPAERSYSSPSRHFTLTLHGQQAIFRTGSGKLIWQKILPHQQGPRDALVTNDGHTILADEWINVASPHAIVLLDRAGGAIAHFSAEDIFRTLGVQKQVIVSKASHGVWITDGPTVTLDGKSVIFHSGGRTLTLHLADGHLSVSD